MFNYKEKLLNLPDKPGVYIMKNSANQIIYIGKAKSLKNRVSSYFHKDIQSLKVKHMMENVADFEYIIVESEIESLILEQNMIKKNKPKYNILLRDDKRYPYIKLTYNEYWPRVVKTRKIQKDGAKYFGPYPSATAVNDVMELFNVIYPIRKCATKIENNAKKIRPCLNYHIGKCLAPCFYEVDRKVYMGYISEIDDYLSGKNQAFIAKIKGLMLKSSEVQEYEKAAYYRDKLNSLYYLNEKQVIESIKDSDQDIIAIANSTEYSFIQIFFIRSGKLLGREHYTLENRYRENKAEVLSSFIKQFYIGASYIPKEIIIGHDLDDSILLNKWLSDKRGTKTEIIKPKKGERKILLEMAEKNAIEMANKYGEELVRTQNNNLKVLNQLQSLLGLDNPPLRMECFDISHISGVEAVGSMVVFENGKAKKSDYRRFRINTFKGNDDYKSMSEILHRRIKRGMEDNSVDSNSNIGFSSMPDLICVDGGKGQVNAVLEALNEFKVNIPVCGLVKDDYHKTKAIIYDNLEYKLNPDEPVYRLLYKIQEEAHRFAITYHRSLHSKSTFKSELDDIKGIGVKRKTALIRELGDLNAIKKASVEELKQVSGMNRKSAEQVYKYFHGEGNN